ncbi:MAG: cyanophycin synthetase, partial [Thermoanaerobaculia bacterium]
IDDFAHHPTAVEKSLEGLRQRHPERRLVAIFEPRSLTAGRQFFFDAYCRAFANADVVLLAPIFHQQRLSDEERLDLGALVRRLRSAGVRAVICASIDEVLATAVAESRPGDVMVTMSSGSFDGLPRRLLARLEGSTG